MHYILYAVYYIYIFDMCSLLCVYYVNIWIPYKRNIMFVENISFGGGKTGTAFHQDEM